VRRISAAVAAIVAATAGAVTVGAGQVAADAAAGTAAGWVVVNPRADGGYDTDEGSASLHLAGGATISCPLTAGWGRADSATLRPNDFFGETGVTTYGSCAGPGPAGVDVISSPGMVFVAEAYDAGADRITGSAYPWTWGVFLDAPDCQVDLYPRDSNAPAPLTYDNATSTRPATLTTGPIDVVVARADGAGCAGVAAVGDEATYETTVVASPGFTVRPL
jgi:hypothetical protein